MSIINDYTTWLRANGKSEKTIVSYVHPIELFLKSCQIENIKDITEKVINVYFAEMRKGYSTASINCHISALKSFFEYNNILLRLPKTKKPTKKVVKIVTEDELVDKIFYMIDRELSTYALRYKAVISFLYYAGLRIDDVANVKREQFNLEKNMATVYIGKQNMEKNILIPIRLKIMLEKYFMSEAEEFNAFNMTKTQIENLFRRLKPMLPELELKPHKLRKSFATNAYKLGMTLEEIQSMFGHANIATTQIYVQEATSEEIKKKYLKLEKDHIKNLKRKKRG